MKGVIGRFSVFLICFVLIFSMGLVVAGGGGRNRGSCTENWGCVDWDECVSGSQSRSCTDSNNCGTSTNRPVLSRACTVPVPCTDSDGGKDYGVRGDIVWSGTPTSDVCARDTSVGDRNYTNNTLMEFWCEEEGLYNELTECPNGCVDGACVFSGVECNDTDGGDNYYVKGIITAAMNGESFVVEDSCGVSVGGVIDPNMLSEHMCLDLIWNRTRDSRFPYSSPYLRGTYDCSTEGKVCVDGACVGEDVCTDTDGGSNPDVKGIVFALSGGSDITAEDVCGVGVDGVFNPNMLIEHSCGENGWYHYNYDCSLDGRVCVDGACVGEDVCTDTDGGIDYYVKGIGDYCPEEGDPNEGVLQENYCEQDGTFASVGYDCPNGCKDGACVNVVHSLDYQGILGCFRKNSTEEFINGFTGEGDSCSRFDVDSNSVITFDKDIDKNFIASFYDYSNLPAASYLMRANNFVLDGSYDEVDIQLYRNGSWFTKRAGIKAGNTFSLGNMDLKILSIDRREKEVVIEALNGGFDRLYDLDGNYIYISSNLLHSSNLLFPIYDVNYNVVGNISAYWDSNIDEVRASSSFDSFNLVQGCTTCYNSLEFDNFNLEDGPADIDFLYGDNGVFTGFGKDDINRLAIPGANPEGVIDLGDLAFFISCMSNHYVVPACVDFDVDRNGVIEGEVYSNETNVTETNVTSTCSWADSSGDGAVDNSTDFNIFSLCFAQNKSDSGYVLENWDKSCERLDYDGDERIGMGDFAFFATCVNDYNDAIGCAWADVNEDGIVDNSTDYYFFELCFQKDSNFVFNNWDGDCDKFDYDNTDLIDFGDFTWFATCVGSGIVSSCIDSDGGEEYYVKGYVNQSNFQFSEDPEDVGLARIDDVCINGSYLQEQICEPYNDDFMHTNPSYYCPNGCVDGACVVDDTCSPDYTDCTIEPLICPAGGTQTVTCVDRNDCGENDVVNTVACETDVCSGCEDSNRNCYAFGYVLDGQYCSDSGDFLDRLDTDEYCDDNFQCGSNICIDNECVSKGFWDYVLEFIRWIGGSSGNVVKNVEMRG